MTGRGKHLGTAALTAAGTEEKDVRQQLERVTQSAPFARAPRMRRFLSFLVEETLAGRAAELKEYTIAREVFDKPVDFEPGTSAVVRVEAGRLRRLLEQYRVEHGGQDVLQIQVPKGSYVPLFALSKASVSGSVPGRATVIEDDHSQAAVAVPGWLSDEQRLVTALSCAFADETAVHALGGDYMTLLDDLYATCAKVAMRHGGEVDARASDRLMVYFGWPSALEDAAGRALTAALEMMSAAESLTVDQPFALRVGVATSNAITRGSTEAVARLRPAVSGEAPAIATRMQYRAPPSAILVAESTRRLTGAAFRFVPTGAQGDDDGLTWRLLGAHTAKTRFRARNDGALTEIVGREEELALIMSRWRLACNNEGQSVALLGDAGIGKSRVAEAVLERIGRRGIRLRAQCSPHHVNSAWFPAVELLRARLGLSRDHIDMSDSVSKLLGRLGMNEDLDRALLAEMLNGEPGTETVGLVARERKRLTFRLLVRLVLRLSEIRPVALLVEDVHWADPTTLEMLQDVVDAAVNGRILVLMTGRADETPALAQNNVTAVRLARLPRNDCNALIDQMIESAKLTEPSRSLIIDRAEGIPLFLEELTKLVLASQPMDRNRPSVPESLSDLLAAQLHRLGPARPIAQIASVIGRTFSRGLLAATAGKAATEVDAGIDQLLAAGVIVRGRSDAFQIYEFRHALLRDAAYRSLLDSTKQKLHLEVANITLECFPHIAAEQPELVGHHLLAGGQAREAVPFWVDAGRRAASRSALAEAATHLRMALSALDSQPSPDTKVWKLTVLIELGLVVRCARGYSDEELLNIYLRARSLAEELGRATQYLEAVYGLWTHAVGCGEWRRGRILAQEFQRRALDLRTDDQLEVECLRLLGACDAFMGDLNSARERHERAFGLYDPSRHGPRFGFDPGAVSAAYLSWTLLLLGEPEKARTYAAKALRAAEAAAHPPTLAMVLSWLLFHAVCDDQLDAVDQYNRQLQAVCAERDTKYWQPFGAACQEWADFVRDKDPERLGRFVELTEKFEERYLTSSLYLLAARMCLAIDRGEQGLQLVERATAFSEEHDEKFWEAEALRLKAELLQILSPANLASSLAAAEQALEVARRQGAVQLERRTLQTIAKLTCESKARRSAACQTGAGTKAAIFI